jgi:hypothetical protein
MSSFEKVTLNRLTVPDFVGLFSLTVQLLETIIVFLVRFMISFSVLLWGLLPTIIILLGD